MEKRLPLQVRVSEVEKQAIISLAQENGCSISEHMRRAALQKHTSDENLILKQQIIPKLCELSNLIELVNDLDARNKLKDWRNTIWSTLK